MLPLVASDVTARASSSNSCCCYSRQGSKKLMLHLQQHQPTPCQIPDGAYTAQQLKTTDGTAAVLEPLKQNHATAENGSC
jgi:hypothetical protein